MYNGSKNHNKKKINAQTLTLTVYTIIRIIPYASGDDDGGELINDDQIEIWRGATEPLLEDLQHGLGGSLTLRVPQVNAHVAESEYGVSGYEARLSVTFLRCVQAIRERRHKRLYALGVNLQTES